MVDIVITFERKGGEGTREAERGKEEAKMCVCVCVCVCVRERERERERGLTLRIINMHTSIINSIVKGVWRR